MTAQAFQLLRWVFTLSVVSVLAASFVCCSVCTCAVRSVTVCVLSVCSLVSSALMSACAVLLVVSFRLVAVVCVKAALTGGSPVAVSAGCVVSNSKRCRVYSTLASLSWSNVCCKAACNRLSTCAFIRVCVAVVSAPMLSATLSAARSYCALAVVVVTFVVPQLTRYRALVSMRTARDFFNSFAEFINIAA